MGNSQFKKRFCIVISVLFVCQVPFLSEGDDLGRREVVHRGKSEMSGDLVVEDVEQNGELFRRLVFLKSSSIVQSEARLVKGAVSKPVSAISGIGMGVLVLTN